MLRQCTLCVHDYMAGLVAMVRKPCTCTAFRLLTVIIRKTLTAKDI